MITQFQRLICGFKSQSQREGEGTQHLARVICRMRELMGQIQPDEMASRSQVINRNLAPLPEQPHPGSAPGRLHSWNSCTLGEPCSLSLGRPAPSLLQGPQHCQPDARSWGALRGSCASPLSGGCKAQRWGQRFLPSPQDAEPC